MNDSEPTNFVTGKKETKREKTKANLSWPQTIVIWLFASIIGIIVAVFSVLIPFVEALKNM
jgi:hypothetical protein